MNANSAGSVIGDRGDGVLAIDNGAGSPVDDGIIQALSGTLEIAAHVGGSGTEMPSDGILPPMHSRARC